MSTRTVVLLLMRSTLIALLHFPGSALATSVADEADVLERLRDGRHVLMLRHANAPGTGDPAHFRIGDCTTQRNLDDDGRAQARTIGAWLKTRGVSKAHIWSSQWCRCLETARLMDIGEVVELSALNSFYEQPHNRDKNLRALRSFLASRAADSTPIVLVTHQVTINAITDAFVASGEGVLIEIGMHNADNSNYTVRARLSFRP